MRGRVMEPVMYKFAKIAPAASAPQKDEEVILGDDADEAESAQADSRS